MSAMNRDGTGFSLSYQNMLQVGDRVATYNHSLGTVVGVNRDEIGFFMVVQLDILPGQFSYDPWDLEKQVVF